MRFGSVCSGIEAASVAWEPLGFTPAWFAEIAPFQSRVLAHRWPHVPNYGDFTRITDDAPAIDVLVGGTPCQSFSVAGGRAGLDDSRGLLVVEFLRLAQRLRPRWLVWENVPGVFSVDDGSAFPQIVGLAVECGYGLAWRVLDAQHLGVPQRRRRVFAVGYLGDWRPPCAVLFERPSVSRDSASRRGAWAQVAAGTGGGADSVGGVTGRVSNALTARGTRLNPSTEPYVVEAVAFHSKQDPISGIVSPALGTGRGSIGVLSFDEQQITHGENRSRPRHDDPAPTLAKQSRVDIIGDLRPRRLTPREWERLQGFPDDHTLVDGASDSARYEALGNSMAVPVVRWIGRRMQMVDELVHTPPARGGE